MESNLRPKALWDHQWALSGQQGALTGLQRALFLRGAGDHFKIDRELSQAGIGPHRLTEGPPRLNADIFLIKYTREHLFFNTVFYTHILSYHLFIVIRRIRQALRKYRNILFDFSVLNNLLKTVLKIRITVVKIVSKIPFYIRRGLPRAFPKSSF